MKPENIRDMSIDSFIAHFAPGLFDLPHGKVNPNQAIMDSLTDEARDLVGKARHYNGGGEFQFTVSVYGMSAETITTQEAAAKELDRMERFANDLHSALRKVDALRQYYAQAAALLSSTEKIPAYILSRNKRDNTAPVTYIIMSGWYDKTLDKLVIPSWEGDEFTGKQHREARARFEQLVRAHHCVGYEITNGYYSHVKFDQYTIKA